MDLNAIAVFVKVVQAGSFSQAARLLGMPNTTVSAKVARLEKQLGVTLIQRTTRKLALTEACSNSVRHAYEQGRDGIVEVSYRLADDRIEVEVSDDGAGFDPVVLERAQQELDEGGLGIAIIRALTDELDIGPNPNGGGSRLRFAKYLN